MRHTAASLLARAGTQAKVAAVELGRSDIQTVLKPDTSFAKDLEATAVAGLTELVALQHGPIRGLSD